MSTKHQMSKIYIKKFDLNGKFQCCLFDLMLILGQINFTPFMYAWAIYFFCPVDQRKIWYKVLDRFAFDEPASNIHPMFLLIFHGKGGITFQDAIYKREQRRLCYLCQSFYRMHLRANEINTKSVILDFVKSVSVFIAKTKCSGNDFVDGSRVITTF